MNITTKCSEGHKCVPQIYQLTILVQWRSLQILKWKLLQNLVKVTA